MVKVIGSVRGVMRQQARGLGADRGARFGACAVMCLALANCTAATQFSGKNSKYSPRVVADGEPVPKGGGSYKVGQPYALNGKVYYPTENPSYRGEGIASWYGPDFHGRLTANGEVYDMHSLSAAHPTMPLPSYARVTNLENGRSIVVRVNDRGPYARNRIIDLSIGTAKALEFYGRGLARVRVEYVGRAPIEGSDDRMLMATLRNGSPAPAPSRVMVASAKPFLPGASDPDESLASAGGMMGPLPPQRPFTLGPDAPAARGPAVEMSAASRPQTRSAVRLPEPRDQTPASAALAAPTTSTASFGPSRSDSISLGLMSGRGLY
jgi:rare lipoprotein A